VELEGDGRRGLGPLDRGRRDRGREDAPSDEEPLGRRAGRLRVELGQEDLAALEGDAADDGLLDLADEADGLARVDAAAQPHQVVGREADRAALEEVVEPARGGLAPAREPADARHPVGDPELAVAALGARDDDAAQGAGAHGHEHGRLVRGQGGRRRGVAVEGAGEFGRAAEDLQGGGGERPSQGQREALSVDPVLPLLLRRPGATEGPSRDAPRRARKPCPGQGTADGSSP